jgi:hypothetical protein
LLTQIGVGKGPVRQSLPSLQPPTIASRAAAYIYIEFRIKNCRYP